MDAVFNPVGANALIHFTPREDSRGDQIKNIIIKAPLTQSDEYPELYQGLLDQRR